MAENRSSVVSRRSLLGAFAATTLVAAPTYSNAFGLLKGAGDIRQIKMYSGRTGESINTIYWIEGDYVKDALKEINYFMRDWRTDEVTNIDTRNVDIMAACHGMMDCSEPYMMLSGYRSPKTNAMLRSRSRNVAKTRFICRVRQLICGLRRGRLFKWQVLLRQFQRVALENIHALILYIWIVVLFARGADNVLRQNRF